MGVYKTYQEAVITDGSTKGIYLNSRGDFGTSDSLKKYGHIAFYSPCDPADYLESLAFFTVRGLELIDGDMFTGVFGGVMKVGVDVKLPLPESLKRDASRFVIHAAAYNQDTPVTVNQRTETMSDLIYIDYNDIDLVIDTTIKTREHTGYADKVRTFKPIPEDQQEPRVDIFFKSGQKVTLSGDQARQVLNHYADRNQ